MEEDKGKKNISKYIIVAIIIILIIIDQASKLYITKTNIVSPDNISKHVLDGVLDITYVENRGRCIWSWTK